MTDLFIQLLDSVQAMSWWEYVAVMLSVGYLLLAAKQSLWCWPAAFVSTLIYTMLFYNGALLMDSMLNVFYMAMAFYGWYSWRNQPLSSHEVDAELPISAWSWQRHCTIGSITLVVSLILGYVMDNYTRADYAYLDTLTTCFSVVATFLVARKVLENWLYWVIIDGISVYLYVNKGFYLTSVLFMFYTTMSVWGYMQWRETLNQSPISQNNQ